MRHTFFAFALLLATSFCTAQATYDARIVHYVGTPYACDGSVTPVLKIINNGTGTMIGCVVETWKNGSIDNSFDWQLPLPAAEGQVRTPSFPAVEAVQGDVLEFRIISVNGIADEVQEGNSLILDVRPALIAGSPMVRVGVTTDDAPQETSWTIRTADYILVANGGPYTAANTYHEHWVELDPFTCYLFEVLDAAGNGISSGFVGISSAGQPVLELMPGTFSLYSDGFVTDNAAALFAAERSGTLGVFPNPSSGGITLDPPKVLAETAHITVNDLTGRVVRSTSITTRNGPLSMDLSGLAAGRYQVRAIDSAGHVLVGTVILTE